MAVDVSTLQGYQGVAGELSSKFPGMPPAVLQKLAEDQIKQSQYQGPGPATTNEIEYLYRQFFGRVADPGGLAYWQTSGKSAGELADIFRTSPEAANLGTGYSQDIPPDQIMSSITAAEAFAGAAGWQNYPTEVEIMNAARIAPQGTQAMLDFFYGNLPHDLQQKFPGAKAGMPNDQYQQTASQYADTYEQWTGQRDMDPAMLQNLVTKQMSSQQFQDYLRTDPTLNQKYGWMKHGLTHQAFLDQLNDPSTQAQLRTRFGTNNIDERHLLESLDKPVAATQTQAAGQTLGSQISSYSQARVTGPGRSQVR